MTVAERWFYLPGIGLLGMMGTIATWLDGYLAGRFRNKIIQRFIYLTAGLLILIFSIRTITRSLDWRNGLILFSHDIKTVSPSFDLRNNYGVELFRAGKIDQAKKQFKLSIELEPNWWVNWNNLGAVVEHKGELKTAELYYRRSTKNGDYYLAYENLIGILIKQKKLQEAKETLEQRALLKFPSNQKLIRYYQYVLQSLD